TSSREIPHCEQSARPIRVLLQDARFGKRRTFDGLSFVAGSAGLFERVKRESDAGGNPEFLENPEEIILDRMFTQREPFGDLAVAVSFGDQNSDLLLALAQGTGSGQARHGGAMLDQRFQHVVKAN